MEEVLARQYTSLLFIPKFAQTNTALHSSSFSKGIIRIFSFFLTQILELGDCNPLSLRRTVKWAEFIWWWVFPKIGGNPSTCPYQLKDWSQQILQYCHWHYCVHHQHWKQPFCCTWETWQPHLFFSLAQLRKHTLKIDVTFWYGFRERKRRFSEREGRIRTPQRYYRGGVK